MCGIILEVTARFNPSTDAVQVTRGRRPLHDLLPPRSVVINESFNPLKDFIEGEGYHGGALSYAPYNSAPEVGIKLEASKIDEYQSRVRPWLFSFPCSFPNSISPSLVFSPSTILFNLSANRHYICTLGSFCFCFCFRQSYIDCSAYN